MKNIILIMAASLMLAGITPIALANAGAAKEVTITGKMVCGKCTLHITDKCQDVVQVEKDGKTVNYLLTQNDVSKDSHEPICKSGSSERVTVTGTVEEKDGKEILTPTKIEVVKS